MKTMQIVKGQVYCDLTRKFPSAKDAEGKFASNIVIVDAPDWVFPGWGYDSSQTGDARFIMPTVQEGMRYDKATGTVYNIEASRASERKALHEATTNDTLEAYRKLRQGDQTIDWQAWLDALDAYNKAVSDTQKQEGYPDTVVYPEYPTKPTA